MMETIPSGTILHGRYRIERVLGSGDFGHVYLALDLKTNQQYALKEYFATGSSGQAQLQHEAKVLSQLHHPNLPALQEAFDERGHYFIVLSYIEGNDLTDLMRIVRQRNELIPLVQVMGWILSVCDAVHYLHSQQAVVIHRDIKPDNIRIMPNGTAILLELGNAKVAADGARTLFFARHRGTPGYSPPEQYPGGPGTDPRSDIYALGATLYFVLTAHEPPSVSVRNEALQHGLPDLPSLQEQLANNPPEENMEAQSRQFRLGVSKPSKPAPRHLRHLAQLGTLPPGVLEQLNHIIERAMAMKQKDRYPSVVEFSNDLRKVMAALTISVAPVPVQQPPKNVQSATQTIESDLVGQQLGSYRLIRLVDRGGFSMIYMGEHVDFGTQAAIKVARAQATSDPAEKLRKEGRILAKLRHPNIARVLGFGTIDASKTSFLVMDYVPENTLRRLHQGKLPIPLNTILAYVKQIASALQYIHNQGYIYRGIKPDNMALGENNEVLLCDFNTIIAVQDTEGQNVEIIGTPPYMAPEQFQGKVSPASDQYALGIVIYEWLCGERPFSSLSWEELKRQHLTMSPPSLRTMVPTLSAMIEQVVFTAMAKDPGQRFTSVQAFVNAFEQACQLQSTPRIFVSHSSKDDAFGKKLVEELRRAIGDEAAVWYDAIGLHGGDAWWNKIKQELTARPIFIVVLSPDALASDWVRDEINMAWRQKNSPARKRIIPILHRACEVPEDLNTLQIISFLEPKPYQAAIDELLIALGIR